jgi:hypothetical protein
MTSFWQIAANRRNASKKQRPTTEEGKRRIARARGKTDPLRTPNGISA